MRLIDADELKTAFPTCDNSKNVLVASVRATINHMPTIEERKTGKWVELSHGILFHIYKCDQCGNTIDMNGVNAGRGDANFCPNCGAKMEGAEE